MQVPTSLDEIPEENGKSEEKKEGEANGTEEKGGIDIHRLYLTHHSPSHPHTSLTSQPHLLPPSHITRSHPVPHIYTYTPSPPPILTHHSITPCTPHIYLHTLTSSHPHTSLCHPLIFHIPSHPHIFTCTYNTMYRTHCYPIC